MLNFKKQVKYYRSSADLLYFFHKKNIYEQLTLTNSACVSSLYLEPKFLDWFSKREIYAIDMESSIILSASNSIKRKAICLMYVSDIVAPNTAMFLQEEKSIKQKVSNSRKNLTEMILRFCNEQ